MSAPVVLDSSVWIEIFNGGPLARKCQREWQDASEVLVPTLVLYEVYKKATEKTSEDNALSIIAILQQHTVVDLSSEVALTAADISLRHKMASADSFVLAHAAVAGATLVTLDNDFLGLPGAKVLRQ